MTQIQKRFPVALDIKRPVSNRAFEVVEGDNGNIIDITLTDDGQAVDLSGCRVLAVFSKSNGTSSQDSAVEGGGVSVEENRVRISLFIPSFAPGMVECELQVYSGAAQTTLVTSAKFNFKCRRGILNPDAVKATDEHPLLVGLIEQCEALEQSFSGFSLEEQARRASEQARACAENEREGTEAQRELTETSRAASETSRASAEGIRQALYGEIASAYESGAFKGDRGDKGEKGDKGDMGNVAYHAFQHAAGGSDALSPAAIGAAAASHTHGGISNDGTIGTAADKAVYTGASGVLQAGALPVSAGGTGAGNAAAARTNLGAAAAIDMATANTNITALQKSTLLVYGTEGTAPNFTITDASVTAYTTWMRRTIRFHAPGSAITINFNGLGAKAIYEYNGKPLNVKYAQIVDIAYDGASFFAVSPGGGAEFPATPAAGGQTLYVNLNTWEGAPNYQWVGTGWGFTARKAGVYRITYKVGSKWESVNSYAKLRLNGVDVANSEAGQYWWTEVKKTIDVTIAANGVLQLWAQITNNDDRPSARTVIYVFAVQILASDVQGAIDEIITVN